MRLLVFAAATVLAGSLFAADPELLSLAMPDSQMMAGVNVEQVMLSPLGQFLQAEAAQQPDQFLQKLIETTGFDPRHDLREILVASSGQSSSAQAIILARGAFDVPKIVEAVTADGATVETYKGVSIVRRQKQDSLAFLDSTVAIMGDDAIVRAAIDPKTAPTSISSALAVQVNELSTTEDAWFVSMVPLSQLQPQSPGGTAPGAGPDGMGAFAMMGNLQQASGGVKFGANVVASVQVVSKTDVDASALVVVLKSLPSIAQASVPKGEAASLVALLQNLNVTADGKVTKISLSVPEQQIEDSINKSSQAMAQANQPHGENSPQLKMRSAPSPTSPGPMSVGVAGAAGAPPQRIRVGGNVQQAKLLQQPAPEYPPLAKQARISGVVRLNVIIGKDGTVENLTVASGHPLLVPPAMEAVKQWVYQPTLLNGQPVEVVTQVDVNFTLVE